MMIRKLFSISSSIGRQLAAALLLVSIAIPALADEDCDEACQAARKAQDPLAPINALLTDNTIGFGPNSDNRTYNYQLQPVFTIEGDSANVILRGLLPYIGIPDGTGGTDYGYSDTVVQGFYVPEVDPGVFKLGYGVQVSLDTAKDGFGGPGNGAGVAVVGFQFAGNLAYGGVVGHLWGEGDFSVTTIQPIAFYSFEEFLGGGSYIGYSNTWSYDWDSKDWVIPIGATFGKTFILDGGYLLDMNAGVYPLVETPDGGNDYQLKFGISWFFP